MSPGFRLIDKRVNAHSVGEVLQQIGGGDRSTVDVLSLALPGDDWPLARTLIASLLTSMNNGKRGRKARQK